MNIKDFMNPPPSTEAELPASLKALLQPSPTEANMNLAMALAGLKSASPSPAEVEAKLTSPMPAPTPFPPLSPPQAKLTTPLPHDLFRIEGRGLSPFEAAVARLTPSPPKRHCYVGMTMNLARRKREHELHYGKIHKWEEHGPYFSKTAAQAAENQLAGVRCDSNEGGRGDEFALWYVYSFEH